MSKLIEQMASQAAAEYLAGYASYMRLDDIDGSMFLEGANEVDNELLNHFIKQVEDNLFQMQLDAEGFNALPDDNPLKMKWVDAMNKKLGAVNVTA